MTPVAAEGIKPSNTMGIARRQSTGQVFLTNQIVSLVGLDPTEDPSLMGTPTARMGKGASAPGTRPFEKQIRRGKIEAQVLLMPTPTVSDTNGPGKHGTGGPDLRTAVALLPTPVTTDAAGTRNATANRKPGSKHHAGTALTDALLPTPTVGVTLGGSKTRSGKRSDEKLLPGIAEELSTGESTPPPSPAGNASSDAELPGQLNLLDAITDND
jgi:hypothetical protein